MEQAVTELEKALLSLDRVSVEKIITDCPSKSIMTCLEQVVVPAMESIGLKWEKGEVALSQVYMGGRIIEEIVGSVLQHNPSPRREGAPRIALVLFIDYHGLGKRLVQTVLNASGYGVIDYGHVSDAEELIKRLETDNIDILLVSTLMLASALKVGGLIREIKERKMNVKVVVGGAPFRFDTNLYKEIGADAMGRNASDVLRIIPALQEQS